MPTFEAIDSAALANFVGSSSQLMQLANQNNGKIALGITGANSEIRDALLTQYTAESVDAITVDSCPAYIRNHAAALAIAIVVVGQAPPDQYADVIAAARAWLLSVRRGDAQVSDLTLAGSSAGGSSTGAGDVRANSPDCRTFERYTSDGRLSGYGRRDPSI